jgi:hypothetical protein
MRQVTALVAGVTRWRRQLDYVVTNITGTSMHRLEPAVRHVRTPAISAAVDAIMNVRR